MCPDAAHMLGSREVWSRACGPVVPTRPRGWLVLAVAVAPLHEAAGQPRAEGLERHLAEG